MNDAEISNIWNDVTGDRPGFSAPDFAIRFAREIERQALERAAERCMSILGYPPREYYAKAIRELETQP
jgi:hypothetical protein